MSSQLSLLITALTLPLLSLAVPQAANNPTTLLPASLPACAQACTVLLQAQSACVPPAAPAAGPAAYQSCFCQSGYLAPLRTGASTVQNVCTGQCQDADFGTIAGWYIGYCKSPPGAAGGGTPTTAPAAASSSADAAGQVTGSGATVAPTGPNWFSTHWQWILMLIILLIAFTAAGVAGTIFRRRYQRRQEAKMAAGGSERGGDSPVDAGPAGRNLPRANGRAQADLGMWAQGLSSVHDVREVPTAYFIDEKLTDKGEVGKESAGAALARGGDKEIEVVNTDAVGEDDGGALGQRRHGLGSKRLKKR